MSLSAQLGSLFGQTLSETLAGALSASEERRKIEASQTLAREAASEKFKSNLSKNFSSFLSSQLTRKQIDKLKKTGKIKELEDTALELYEATGDPRFSFQQSLEQQLQPQAQESFLSRLFTDPGTLKERGVSKFEGGLVDLLRGKAEERPVETLLKKQPAAALRRPAAGLAESAESIAALSDPLQLGVKLGMELGSRLAGKKPRRGAPSLSELIRGEEEDLTEEEKAAGRELELAGALAGDVALGLVPGKAARAVAKGAEEVLQPTKGLRVAKPRAVTPRIKPTEVPKKAVAERVTRAARPRMREIPKEVELRKQQLKSFPKYSQEIEADILKKEAQAARIKRASTITTEQGRKAAAATEIPKIRQSFARVNARVKGLEQAITKATPEQKARYGPLLKAVRKEAADTEDMLRTAVNISKTGEARLSAQELRQQAQKAVDEMRELASDLKKEATLTKAQYNPETVKRAKAIAKKKAPPGKPIDDYHQRVHKRYEEGFNRRLKEVGNEMKKARGRRDIESMQALNREKNLLNKRIRHEKASQQLHDRDLRLRQIAERKKAEARFQRLEKAKPTEKVEKVTQAGLKRLGKEATDYARAPTAAKATQLAERSGVPKEAIEGVKKESSDFLASLRKVRGMEKKAAESSANFLARRKQKIASEFGQFRSLLRDKKYFDALKTKVGFAVAGNIIESTLDAAGVKIPRSRTILYLLGGRSISRQLVNITFDLLVKPPIKKIKEEREARLPVRRAA